MCFHEIETWRNRCTHHCTVQIALHRTEWRVLWSSSKFELFEYDVKLLQKAFFSKLKRIQRKKLLPNTMLYERTKAQQCMMDKRFYTMDYGININ